MNQPQVLIGEALVVSRETKVTRPILCAKRTSVFLKQLIAFIRCERAESAGNAEEALIWCKPKGDETMATSVLRPVKAGDKVVRDVTTVDHDKVRLGDFAPAFVRAGDKVVRDAATKDEGKVRLGDFAPAFAQ